MPGCSSSAVNRRISATLASKPMADRRSPKLRQTASMPPEQPISTRVNFSRRNASATNPRNAHTSDSCLAEAAQPGRQFLVHPRHDARDQEGVDQPPDPQGAEAQEADHDED